MVAVVREAAHRVLVVHRVQVAASAAIRALKPWSMPRRKSWKAAAMRPT